MSLGFKSALINDLPLSVDCEYGVWGKIYDGEPNKIAIYVFDHTGGMEEHGFFLIQKGKFSAPLNWSDMDVTSLQVESLRQEIAKIRGASEAAITAIQGQINRLLSITLDTKDD